MEKDNKQLKGGELIMSSEEIFEKVKGVIVEQLGVAEDLWSISLNLRNCYNQGG